MRWPARVQLFFRSVFLRRKIESDLEEEMRSHLEAEVASNIQAGMICYPRCYMVSARGTPQFICRRFFL
jgi:hypothetical protein